MNLAATQMGHPPKHTTLIHALPYTGIEEKEETVGACCYSMFSYATKIGVLDIPTIHTLH